MSRIREEFRTANEKFAARSQRLRHHARKRVHEIRIQGAGRLFHFQLDGLERVENLLNRAPELPVVSRVTDAAGKLVHRGLEAVGAPPLADYDSLNVRDVNSALRDLGYVELLRLHRYEETHKNRKTVITSANQMLARLEKAPEAPVESPAAE
ncbi:MAG: hypothetical protein JRJ84_13675 [Deltaproteobacteria bacterium]|nr:hypothetical protein [Deltaproteobacteria bacterium]